MLLYFHGGGYVIGSAAVYRDLVSRIEQMGAFIRDRLG